jgi:hypothetical protein
VSQAGKFSGKMLALPERLAFKKFTLPPMKAGEFKPD